MISNQDQLKELIKQCKKHNRFAQRQLYDNYQAYVCKIVTTYVNDANDIAETVQDSFLKAFISIDRFDEFQNFTTWLRKITVHTSIDRYRKQLKTPDTSDVEELMNIPCPSVNDILSEMHVKEIISLVHLLPIAARTCFLLYAVEGYTYEEISKELNISMGSVKSNISNARQKLKLLIVQESK